MENFTFNNYKVIGHYSSYILSYLVSTYSNQIHNLKLNGICIRLNNNKHFSKHNNVWWEIINRSRNRLFTLNIFLYCINPNSNHKKFE